MGVRKEGIALYRPLRFPTQRRHPPVKHDVNMLEGSPFVKIILFVLPLIAVNLLQALYSAADMMVVGLSGVGDAVGAVGATSAFTNLLLNLFIGFSSGANVVAARSNGARDTDSVSRTVHTAITMSLIFGCCGALLGAVFAKPVYVAMGNSGTLLSLSLLYTYIYLAGLPFLALTNYASALLHAKGDTKTPLYVLSLTGLFNVGLNLLFVLALDMSVDGVALATSISNLASAVVLLLALRRTEGAFHLRLRSLRLDRKIFAEIIRIGLPAGIQASMFSLSNILIHSSVLQIDRTLAPNAAYSPVIKGSSVVQNLETFSYAFANAACSATVTFVSCHDGTRDYRRMPRVIAALYIVMMLCCILPVAVLFLLRDPLLALYDVSLIEGDKLAQIAYDTAITRMVVIWFSFPLQGLMQVASHILRGLGKSISPMLVNVFAVCGIRVLWVYTFFRYSPDFLTLYLSYPVTWALTFLIMLPMSIVALRKRARAAAAAIPSIEEKELCHES